MKQYKNMIVFPLLLAVTFLLLEIPEHIFKNKDMILSKESGGSVYEIQTIKSIDTFAEKVSAFEEYNRSLSTIGNTRELDNEEMQESIASLQRELDLMTNGMYKMIVGQIGDNDVEMRGMEAQVIHRSDKSKEQFVWEIGYLLLLNQESGGVLTFLYDLESFKIFQTEWYFNVEADSDLEPHLEKLLITDYYKEAGGKEVTVFEENGYALISVLSEKEVYDNRLIVEIQDFMNYYWGVNEIDS